MIMYKQANNKTSETSYAAWGTGYDSPGFFSQVKVWLFLKL